MTEQQSDSGKLPEPKTRKRSRNISAIWLVPVAALIISLWLAYQHYTSLGSRITIHFNNAEGIEAGKTPVRLRNVEVGKVEKITLNKNLSDVIVSVRMTKDTDTYLNDKTRFWIERPRIGLGGISGIGTLFSGAFLSMSTQADPNSDFRDEFIGLEEPPLSPEVAPGVHLLLTSTTGASISPGTPVFHKRVEVGKVESRKLADDGQKIIYGIFVQSPYHKLINSNTKFWELSSFTLDLGSAGIRMDVEPLPVLLSGGIEFDTPQHLMDKNPATNGTSFILHIDREQAKPGISSSENALGYLMYFDETLRGLTIGSLVEFRGVEIGYVADISIDKEASSGDLSVPVLVFIEPQRFGIGEDKEALRSLLQKAVQKGLRARLQTSSLITGQLYIELTMTDNTQPGLITVGKSHPEFPTVPSPFGQIADNISAVLVKLEKLPLEDLTATATNLIADIDSLMRIPDDSELGDDPGKRRKQLKEAPLQQLLAKINHSLDGLNPILHSRDTKNLPAELGRSISNLNGTLTLVKRMLEGDAARSPIYYELSTTLKELKRAAQSIRTLSETLDEKPNAFFFGND